MAPLWLVHKKIVDLQYSMLYQTAPWKVSESCCSVCAILRRMWTRCTHVANTMSKLSSCALHCGLILRRSRAWKMPELRCRAVFRTLTESDH